MNMKKFILLTFISVGLLSACNDEYLDKYPLTSLTEQNAFLEYNNYKAYMYPCYELFTNTNIRTNFNENSTNSQRYGDWYAGIVTNRDNSLIHMDIRQLLRRRQAVVGTSHIYEELI